MIGAFELKIPPAFIVLAVALRTRDGGPDPAIDHPPIALHG